MQKLTMCLPEIKLAGIKVRTSHQNELDWANGKIFPCVKKYFQESLVEKITNRQKPGVTFCVYTEYTSGFTGEYTYFIGEEVIDHNVPNGIDTLTILPQTYTKFTTKPGTMPDVVKGAWQKIWGMSDADLGGKRNFHADFEIYDDRASDPNHHNIVLDIYVGIEKL